MRPGTRIRAPTCVSVNMDGFISPSKAIKRSPWFQWRLSTETVLQIEACQSAVQFGYFKPLNEQGVHSKQQSLRASRARNCA